LIELKKEFVDNVSANVRKPNVETLITKRQSPVIEAKQM